MPNTTALLERWNRGDEDARAQLLTAVYDELHRAAMQRMRDERPGHTLSPTALVNEAWLKLIETSRVDWQSRAHFIAMAATVMREILIDHARRRGASKRDFGHRVTLAEGLIGDTSPSLDVLDLDRALQELASIDEQKVKIVELRFFGGLSIEETAVVLDISTATIGRQWRGARAWLIDALAVA